VDLITHGVLGAVASQGLARKHQIGIAAAIGFAAAMLPDADALIQSAQDPLLRLEYHRQFTHALIFIPVGGLIAASVLWIFLRRRVSFAWLYVLATAAYATAGILDACTSYGTQLLWPFSDERIAWRIVSIVDPLVTLTLIGAVVFARVKKSSVPARIGLTLVVCYLLVGLFQRGQAEDAAYAIAGQRGHTIEKIEVKPSLGNLLLWRSVYRAGDSYYVDAIRLGLLADVTVYPGGTVGIFNGAEAFADLKRDSVMYQDIERFNVYSDGFLVRRPEQPSILGDLRYAMLPNSLRPLWGIVVNTSEPGRHADYKDFRGMDEGTVPAFIQMLFGRSGLAIKNDDRSATVPG
jgi:inner membrane protein